MWLIPSDILESGDWSRLPDYVAKKAIVIVTGTWEGAELFDRPLAYMIADILGSKGFFPVVMSDIFILDTGKRLGKLLESKTPIISVGSRIANALTALIAEEAGIDPSEYAGIVEWRRVVVGLAYGRDPYRTRDMVHEFLNTCLENYIEKIKTRRYPRFINWLTDKAST